ncbi:hypothetical protein AKJ51_00695 [candidate division MSBL1 archaeon SCGC-AAA382A20]|uniref:Molecular chaperone DnaK n=1 Tax=candidate division MSBL1 archaeon SCGC-AAA382A20 TaxID=1698280 RepID=A0A133VMH3_9EURY|nr:hypothetical protein AKJ51_00695 [candidate division MSBL1 archaeon SCGC-AAA382A20]
MIISGIDAGFSSIKVGVPDSVGKPQLLHNKWGNPKTDSAVFFTEEGDRLTGEQARNAYQADQDHGAIGWKNYIGTEETLCIDHQGNEYTARDLLVVHLQAVKEAVEQKTGEPVQEITLCHPADYTDRQRWDILQAPKEVGLEVLKLVPEPTAAALGNELHKRGSCTALTYDLGGWTFDVSIITPKGNLFKVVATDGKSDLGGRDIDAKLIEKALDRFENEHGFRPNRDEYPVFFQDLTARIEQLKITLSVREKATLTISCRGELLQMELTRSELESLIEPEVEETINITQQVVKDAGLTFDDIDIVLPVGGGSAIPAVKEELNRISNGKVSSQVEPLYAAAYGAVIASRIEKERKHEPYMVGNKSLPSTGMSLEDVVGNPIGVLVLDDNEELVTDEILSKNISVPSEQTELYKPAVPNQTEVLIYVVQASEGTPKDDATILGEFELDEIPPSPDRKGRIEITFEFDVNGMLRATARDKESGKSAELEIQYREEENDAA